MKQQTPRPSSVDRLGLAAWASTGTGTPGELGSLSGVLGEFLPAPSPLFVVPAQRTATLLEAHR